MSFGGGGSKPKPPPVPAPIPMQAPAAGIEKGSLLERLKRARSRAISQISNFGLLLEPAMIKQPVTLANVLG